jgi:hypothetical protein
MVMATQATDDGSWFYEENGQRKGAVDEAGLVELIKSGKVTYGTSVWKKGFPNWLKIENTDLKAHLEEIAPPPLAGDKVNNSVVWVLAFAPILGYFLEFFVAGIVAGANGQSDLAATIAVNSGAYWYVTVILNVSLSYFDANRLEKAGHDTAKFGGMAWLVPVYLFQRAQNLKQNQAYFVVWIVCFVLILGA